MSANDFVLQNSDTGLWEVYFYCQRVVGSHPTKQAATTHLMRVQKGLVAWQYDAPAPPDLTKSSDTPPPKDGRTRAKRPGFARTKQPRGRI